MMQSKQHHAATTFLINTTTTPPHTAPQQHNAVTTPLISTTTTPLHTTPQQHNAELHLSYLPHQIALFLICSFSKERSNSRRCSVIPAEQLTPRRNYNCTPTKSSPGIKYNCYGTFHNLYTILEGTNIETCLGNA